MATTEVDDVPPLEDMTDYIEKLKMKESVQIPSSKHVTSTDSSLLKFEESDDRPGIANPELLVLNKREGKGNSSSNSTSCSKEQSGRSHTKANTSTTSGGGFGGMKKGFLSGSKSQKKKSNKSSLPSNSIPFIQSKQQEETDSLRFKEVQEELKKTHPLLATKDWVTDDLLTKISSNTVLSKAFSDPKLFQVLEEFQKNPQQAMMAAKHDPVMTEFLQEFCSVMGDHFNTMADLQEGQQPIEEVKQVSEDEKAVQDLLGNPQVKAALLDPDIIKLMELLKSNPSEAQRFLNAIQFKPDIRSKLTTLIENKLLSIQST